MIAAMETPDTRIIVDVVVALGIALAGGFVASRLGLSAIVGYVVAGILISPFTPGFVADEARLRLMADIGIVLLMFGIGVQVNLRDLLKVGTPVAFAATAQVAAILAFALPLALLFGWDRNEALFIGAAAGMSSSTVIAKIVSERGELNRGFFRITISWSLIQDLWTVVLVAVLIALTEGGGGTGVIEASLRAAVFVLVVMVLGFRFVPMVLDRIAQEGSRELFVLAIAGLALGTAFAAEEFGLSLALGAFLAGIVVSESDLSHRVLGELLPARDVFAVLFFVTVGMLIDPGVVVRNFDVFIALLALIMVVKGLICVGLVRAIRQNWDVSLKASTYLAQAGEFAFVLAAVGFDRGAVSSDVFSVLVAATAVSIVLMPFGTILGARLGDRMMPAPIEAPIESRPTTRLGRRAVICGFGDVGRLVAQVLSARFDITVVDQDLRVVRDVERQDVHAINGDASSPEVMEQMHLEDARVLVVAMPDPFAVRLVVERARAAYPDLQIVARALNREDAAQLRRSGANEAVVADRELALEMTRYSLLRFGVDSRQALAIIQRLRAE
jgi:monovalent cation:H+ antiporter-2, CPA2 family